MALLLLSVLAACFALGGLWRSSRSTSHEVTARALYQQRLDELTREVDESEARQILERETGRALLHDTDETTAAPGTEKRHGSGLAIRVWLLALAIPLAGWLWFYAISDPGLSEIQGAEVVLRLDAGDATQAAEIATWRTRLERRVASAPDDAKSLYLLAHARLKQGDFQRAAEAFARAAQINPDDLTIKVYWLQARFLSAKGSLDELSLKLADEVLAASPNLSVVLEILAMDAVRKGQPDLAVRHLNRALSGARDANTQINFISAINELRKQFENPGVTVSVTAEGDVPHAATLFVIARPVGGGMPLAVVKMPALALPQTVRLDDLVSMSEAVKLSTTEQFEVVVRISESGSPMPQAGDWQWQSAPLTLPVGAPLQAKLAPPD
ncbi:MAG: c-type cytochrome biogenesis protein CcmI [Pseudomonadales bacterium]